MRFFLDTEFNEDGKTIELISIALLTDFVPTGERKGESWTFYAVSSEFDEAACNPWVRQHVLPQLANVVREKREDIARRLVEFVRSWSATWKDSGDNEPAEFWAYFAAYDHVALAQLFGPMVNLPEGFPMYTLDLKQVMHLHGITKEQLPDQDSQTEHDAVADADWNRKAWHWLQRNGYLPPTKHPSERAPVPQIIYCPMCSARHIDKGRFATKIHHTHACQNCGHTWRPAVVPTVGVQFLPGFRDE